MNSRFAYRANKGTSVLEASILLSVLGAIGIAVVGLLHAFSLTFSLGHLVDWALLEANTRTLNIVANSDGETTLTPNITALNSVLNNIRLRVATEFSQQNYGLEAAYAVVNIDKISGQKTTLNVYLNNSITDGTYSLPSNTQSCPGIGQLISNYAEQENDSSGGGSSRSSFAFPGGVNGEYLERVILIGARLSIGLEDTFTGSVLSALGLSQEVHKCKVVVSRGDIGE